MTGFPRTSAWPERTWRNIYVADVARGIIPGARVYSSFGEMIVSGSGSSLVRETGMSAALVVPNSVRLTAVSTSASDVGQIVIVYLDGNLAERTETIALNGITPVQTVASDVRAVNLVYSRSGPLIGNVSLSSGGVDHALISAGQSTYRSSVQRVPVGKRLMINAVYGASVSGSSDSRVVIKMVSSTIHGESFANAGLLFPVAGVGVQDSSEVMSGFGPLPVSSGEWIGFQAQWDKGSDIIAGFVGWLEDI